jgi:two-component system, chemotaxis family, chemotaxis protein CheY
VSQPGGTFAVLVVDDDPAIQYVLAEALRDDGYEVRTVTNGAEALDVLRTWTPDVIVLDLMMPLMDGWTFRTEQRARGLAVEVSVIVLSASRGAEAAAQELEAMAVLAKPFNLIDLLDTVERACAGTSHRDQR